MRDRVSFLLYGSAATAHAMADDAVRELGLSARGVGVLTLILEREPMTQRALGSLLRIDRSTMVKLLDALEAKGFVERRRHPSDRQ